MKDPTDPVWEDWDKECQTRCLYSEHFASEGAARVYWSEPAIRVGLPLLADIYGKGFYDGNYWSGSALHQLLAEIESLQHVWDTMGLSGESRQAAEEQAAILRRAAAVGLENNGVVVLG